MTNITDSFGPGYDRSCHHCGRPVYAAFIEQFGATGSMRSTLIYRHEDSQRVACEQVTK